MSQYLSAGHRCIRLAKITDVFLNVSDQEVFRRHAAKNWRATQSWIPGVGGEFNFHNKLIRSCASLTAQEPVQRSECSPDQKESDSGLENAVVCALQKFRSSTRNQKASLRHYISLELFEKASRDFVQKVLKGNGPLLLQSEEEEEGSIAEDRVLHAFLEYTKLHHTYEIQEYERIVNCRDLSQPHLWFPVARAVKRRVIYHAGPTNSGKTYNALLAMKHASSGVYCGPLRLLAMEVYESCNREGTYCSLITGQERREVPGARHTACTVEMMNLEKLVDVAVIDEIQLIGDESRGWAWTRALLGVPAREIHVCGDGSALPLVKWMTEQIGEEFEVRKYDRFTPLEIEHGGLEMGYSAVEAGDCIVAFSRADIFQIKQLIEVETQYKSCVVYGALPPETRRQQAKLFNDPTSGYDIMVASDAVGMGLNLNIRRVIFHKMDKREGHAKPTVPVSVSMIKQIAGRAGRRSSQYSVGKATCREKGDVRRLREGLGVPLDRLATSRAGIYPEYEHFEAFAASKQSQVYSDLIKEFSQEAVLGGKYFFCKQESTIELAKLLERVSGLSMKDLYSFCMAPASTGDLRIRAAILYFAKKYAAGEACELEIDPGDVPPTTSDAMRDFEAAHQVATLWLWLSNRFDTVYFANREKADTTAQKICRLLSQGLEIMSERKEDARDVEQSQSKDDSMPKGKKSKRAKQICKTAKQLFSPYRHEFFALLHEIREESDEQSAKTAG
ncbi:ATP-dependent RNA helicase SUV3L [Picochlorum sp. SENEW3]|nr:ATP-dependent RNA helicase SUV3L [Picochlorum sp. SENEW3]